MPQVNIIGEVIGCSEFNKTKLYCKWSIVPANEGWVPLNGDTSGETHLDIESKSSQDDPIKLDAVWMHPIDVSYSVTAINGWPRMRVEVWHEDSMGTLQLAGYGACFIPTTPGEHMFDCVTWTPKGSFFSNLRASIFGTTPLLEQPSLVLSSKERFDLTTNTSGTVHFRVEVLVKGFQTKGSQFS